MLSDLYRKLSPMNTDRGVSSVAARAAAEARPRRAVAVAGLVAAVIGCVALSVGAGGAVAAPTRAPIDSPGFVVPMPTARACVAAAAHNAAYFHSQGGGEWDYTCWTVDGAWFYTSPYAA